MREVTMNCRFANHRTALGLDPRATLHIAQAANGPRVKPEDGTVVLADGEQMP